MQKISTVNVRYFIKRKTHVDKLYQLQIIEVQVISIKGDWLII